MSYEADWNRWTYGAEHELGDWDRSKSLPEGFSVDEKDVTVMNSNGIAADPKGKLYGFGGELCTPPTCTIQGQVDKLMVIRDYYPDATVNHRSNLHIHIRVPGLAQDLDALKRIAAWARWEGGLRSVINLIEPIPQPRLVDTDFLGEYEREKYLGAVRRYKRRLVSHHTIVTAPRLEKQLDAFNLAEFFAAEAPADKDGLPLWHLAPRHAVNLRHLREETETIEFRHFPGTLNPLELQICLEWCRDYLRVCLGHHPERSPLSLYKGSYHKDKFPSFPDYQHWREVRYRKTCHDGTLTKEEIAKNIEAILAEDKLECPF